MKYSEHMTLSLRDYLRFRGEINGSAVVSKLSGYIGVLVSMVLIWLNGIYLWFGGILLLYVIGIQISRITFWTSIKSEYKMTTFYQSEVEYSVSEDYFERKNKRISYQMPWKDLLVYYQDDFRICILGEENQQFYYTVQNLKKAGKYEYIISRLKLDYPFSDVKTIEGANNYNSWVNRYNIKTHIDDLKKL